MVHLVKNLSSKCTVLEADRPLLRKRPRTPAGPVAQYGRWNNAMVRAIARAFRWREMLENGTHATIAEIAAAEKINETYVGRVLRRRHRRQGAEDFARHSAIGALKPSS